MSAIVSAVIGLAALLMGLPLVFTIMVVNFIGGYIPYIGAFLGGGLAVIVALGDGGLVTAAVMLLIVLAANLMLENFVEPKVMGTQPRHPPPRGARRHRPGRPPRRDRRPHPGRARLRDRPQRHRPPRREASSNGRRPRPTDRRTPAPLTSAVDHVPDRVTDGRSHASVAGSGAVWKRARLWGWRPAGGLMSPSRPVPACQLAGEAGGHVCRKDPARLDPPDRRLRVDFGPECEAASETDDDQELNSTKSRRQHIEEAGRPVTVAQRFSLGAAPCAARTWRRRHSRRRQNYQCGPDDVHKALDRVE